LATYTNGAACTGAVHGRASARTAAASVSLLIKHRLSDDSSALHRVDYHHPRDGSTQAGGAIIAAPPNTHTALTASKRTTGVEPATFGLGSRAACNDA
jgi:hypothetical protein